MINLTPKRKQILDVLEKSRTLLSAQDVHAKLRDTDLATVYRNLNLFVHKGLIRELMLGNGEAVYEFIRDMHHHIICDECDSVDHVMIPPKVVCNIPGINHLDPESLVITVRGRCRS